MHAGQTSGRALKRIAGMLRRFPSCGGVRRGGRVAGGPDSPPASTGSEPSAPARAVDAAANNETLELAYLSFAVATAMTRRCSPPPRPPPRPATPS